ncbi:MAG: hypothetical protein CMJ20_06430 [Phycisphaeraceae bacterium]|nr:hypothetical protein [Phycisphaeraceae bacterium]
MKRLPRIYRTGRDHYSHVIAASCFGIQAIGIGTYASFGVLFHPLITEFGWSRATIAGASSIAFFLMGLLGMVVGRLNDRIGPRKLMTGTAVCFGLGCFLMSRLETVWQLYIFWGIIFGVGLSSIDVIAMTTTARWFVKKRGMVTGIVKVGSGAGQMVIPFLMSLLIIRLGWRNACAIIGISVMTVLVVIAQMMRRDPGVMGLLPDANELAESKDAPLAAEGLSRCEAVNTRSFWIICSANLLLCFSLMAIMVHIVPFAIEIKIPTTQAAGVLATIGGVSMAGRFASGLAIDRIGSQRVMMVCAMLLITALLWLQIATTPWMLYLFAAIYGVALGGCFTAVSPLVAELFGIKSHGALFGIVAFIGTLGGAVGPFLTGSIFDFTGRYGPAIWICVLMSVLGFVLISMLKPVPKK